MAATTMAIRVSPTWPVQHRLFKHCGVPLWVPEVGGAIDPTNEAHEVIMSVFEGIGKTNATADRV